MHLNWGQKLFKNQDIKILQIWPRYFWKCGPKICVVMSSEMMIFQWTNSTLFLTVTFDINGQHSVWCYKNFWWWIMHKKTMNAWKEINRVKWADKLKTDTANLRASHHWLIIKTAQHMAYNASTVHSWIPTRHVFLSQVGGAIEREWAGHRKTIYIFNSLETTH